jgi:hypothetical protein
VDAKTLITKALEQRESWVELEADGRAVKVRRPAEAQMFRFRSGNVSIDEFLRCAVAWKGFKEAHILPRGVGGDAEVPFDADLWATLATDNMVWCGKVSEAVVNAITAHLKASEDAAKN